VEARPQAMAVEVVAVAGVEGAVAAAPVVVHAHQAVVAVPGERLAGAVGRVAFGVLGAEAGRVQLASTLAHECGSESTHHGGMPSQSGLWAHREGSRDRPEPPEPRCTNEGYEKS
jgi:hypothetical protein